MAIDIDYPAGAGGGSGDITAVGNILTGAAFTVAVPGDTLTWDNATSGTVTLQTVAGALGTVTISLPASTGTIVLTTDSINVLSDVTLAGTAAAMLLVRNAGNTAFEDVDMSGDVTISATGVTTVANLAGDVSGPIGTTVVADDSHDHIITNIDSFTSAELATQLSDETGGGLAVFNASPTIVTPTIASFTNAQHDHTDAASGGAIARLVDANFIESETPTGDLDGVDVTYTLANTPTAGTLQLYLNSGRLSAGASADYTLSGLTITFNFAPVAADVILADYRF